MPKKKNRETIPPHLAARVLFMADRTCCVCRIQGKHVQLHHIDDDPSNNVLQNIAVLCFDCHRDTQIIGGFDRKLNADQVILYSDDWNRIVSQRRDSHLSTTLPDSFEDEPNIELITSLAEIYRDKEAYTQLAIHYNIVGNPELRDKYIEIAIQNEPLDEEVIFLRSLQKKTELIPLDVIDREERALTRKRNWLQRARLHKHLGQPREAVDDYLRGIQASLSKDRVFTAAIYLKELVKDGLIDELFVLALKQATEQKELWWQIRSLQELGWYKELGALLLKHEHEIEESGDLYMLSLLAQAKGDEERYVEVEKKIAKREAGEQTE